MIGEDLMYLLKVGPKVRWMREKRGELLVDMLLEVRRVVEEGRAVMCMNLILSTRCSFRDSETTVTT